MEEEQKQDIKAKVKDLAAQRIKKEKKERPAPIKKVRVYQALTDAINRAPYQRLPVFETSFLLFEPEPGARLVLRAGDDHEVTLVSDETVVNDLAVYLRDKLGEIDDYQLTNRETKEAVAYWRSYTQPIARPLALGWQGDDRYTFRRLPWAQEQGAWPTWETLLKRMSNSLAFCHWVGSLFYPESSLHQYAWVHGEGGDGKGAINRFLARVFGTAYCSKQPPSPSDRFWTYGLLGKRLVVFPDCNSQAFVTSGIFKSLTGGDPVDVEAKGKMSFTFKPDCKFLFFSNVKPSVTAEKSDVRRIVYCEFEKRDEADKDDPDFEARLWSEGGAFLTLCMRSYLETYPRHGQMDVDNARLDDWIEVQEERFESILDAAFLVNKAPANKSRWVSGADLTKKVASALHGARELEAFRSWLGRRHDVRRASVDIEGKKTKRYVGLIAKNEYHI